jgi:hypothetical protein
MCRALAHHVWRHLGYRLENQGLDLSKLSGFVSICYGTFAAVTFKFLFRRDGSELIRRFITPDALNTTTRRDNIGTRAPVLRFRPGRSLFVRIVNFPNEVSLTASPCVMQLAISFKTSSTKSVVSDRDNPTLRCTASLSSALVRDTIMLTRSENAQKAIEASTLV